MYVTEVQSASDSTALGLDYFKLHPYEQGEDGGGSAVIVDGSDVLGEQALLWKCQGLLAQLAMLYSRIFKPFASHGTHKLITKTQPAHQKSIVVVTVVIFFLFDSLGERGK